MVNIDENLVIELEIDSESNEILTIKINKKMDLALINILKDNIERLVEGLIFTEKVYTFELRDFMLKTKYGDFVSYTYYKFHGSINNGDYKKFKLYL